MAQPPQIPSNVQIVHTYRFRSTSDTAQNISDVDLIGIAGAVCDVANTSLALLCNSVRVHRVSIWAPPASQGASSTCSVEWATDTGIRMVEVSDTTVSTARPAHVSSKPPAGSFAWFWIGTQAGTTVMRLNAPIGSIIDVHCTHVLLDTQAAGGSLAVAAGTLGALYYPPLDGVSDVYLPVSLGTTT